MNTAEAETHDNFFNKTKWGTRLFKLIKGKNATTLFLPQTKKDGWVRFDIRIRYIPDTERECLTDDQARNLYKMVETDKIINIETIKQDIENDKMIRNRLKEEYNTEANPYQIAILNKVSRDKIKTEQMINWSILSDMIKYIDGSSDMIPSLTGKPLD